MARKMTDLQKVEQVVPINLCKSGIVIDKMVKLIRAERTRARKELMAKLDSPSEKTDVRKVREAYWGRKLTLTERRRMVILLRYERARTKRNMITNRVLIKKIRIRKTTGRQLEL